MGTKLLGWFGLVLIVLIANTVLSYRALRTISMDEEEVTRTHDVLTELDAVFSTLQDAETGQRGYLLTGREDYLGPYNEAVSNMDTRLNTLRGLIRDNPNQQALLRLLEPLIKEKLTELRETIELRRQKGSEAAQQIVLTNSGQRYMDEIRQNIAVMKGTEAELRDRRIKESQESMRRAMLTMVFTSFLAVAMLFVFYFQVSRGMRERARLLADERAASLKAEEAFQTEQRARAEAEQANRLKDEFLATVSHELRTPLTSILGWSSMMRGGFLDEATEERALESIERNAQSQAQLVEDLLDVSRIITGKLRLDVRAVELTTVITNALDAVRPAADAKRIRLHSILDPSAGPVSGDPERLQQVIWNLLSNGIKFTPKGGRVEVRLERVNSHVEIIVSDTGQGIAPEFLPHVFERFRQADGGLTRAQSGLGLGLAIARHLVESHGGSITVDSPGEGRGAIFTVYLPLMGVRAVDVPVPAGEAQRVHPTAGRGAVMTDGHLLKGVRVLAVDDQPDTLEIISTILTRAGAEVQTTDTVPGALARLETWKPDLIIADIGMPDEDGFALIGKLRALSPEAGGAIPAIALTAYARVADRLRTLSAGYQMHVPKPVEPAELTAIVASLTGRTGKEAV